MIMGNDKTYTIRTLLLPGEDLISRDEIATAAHSDVVMIGTVPLDNETMIMIMVESCSMAADDFIEHIRARYPRRWCVATRYDADWSDFRVTIWSGDDGIPPHELVYT